MSCIASCTIQHHRVDIQMELRLSFFLFALVFWEQQCGRRFCNIPVRRCVLQMRRLLHDWGIYQNLGYQCWTVFPWWTSMVWIRRIPSHPSQKLKEDCVQARWWASSGFGAEWTARASSGDGLPIRNSRKARRRLMSLTMGERNLGCVVYFGAIAISSLASEEMETATSTHFCETN